MTFKHQTKQSGDLIKSADWNAMGQELERLGDGKLDRAGDTVAGELKVAGNLTVGAENRGASLQVLNRQQDANGDALVVGPKTGSHLRLGYHEGYSWVQSHGNKPLAINPMGNNVGVKSANPQSSLSVGGNVSIGANVASKPAPANGLLVEGRVAVGALDAAVAPLDIGQVRRSGPHPSEVKGLYVTGDFGTDQDGVEFRHSNGAQGIGIAQNTLYAAGSSPDQDLNLRPKGRGVVGLKGPLSLGDRPLYLRGDSNHGMVWQERIGGFPLDGPLVHGYSGGALASRRGDTTTLALYWGANGNVGIGTATPRSALDTGRGVMTGAAEAYQKAQWTLSGGGQVFWEGVGGRLRWNRRFIAITMGDMSLFSSGYVDINQPTTDIPGAYVYNGVARSANGSGVLLYHWEALYAVHEVGGAQGNVTFRIQVYSQDFVAPSNWILVAVVNGDDNTLKLGTGAVILAGRGMSNGLANVRFQAGRSGNWSIPQHTGERIIREWVPLSGFQVTPSVIVNLAALDVLHDRNLRIDVYASDVSAAGFMINYKTWGDTIIYAVIVYWFAFVPS